MKVSSATNDRFLVRDRLPEIVARSLVAVGSHDFICSPVQARTIHEGIRGSQLVEFENSGHLPWLEEPDAFFSTVRRFVLNAPASVG
jgi:proline iminopeptidase